MKVQIGSAVTIDIWEVKKEVPDKYRSFFRELREAFTYVNPEKEKYYRDPQRYFYLRRAPQYIKLYKYHYDRYFEFPIGLLPTAVKIANKFGIDLEFEDNRVYVSTSEPYNFVGTLFNYQKQAVENWVYNKNGKIRKLGLLIAPTGSGKTVMGVKLFTELGQRTLVLAHTREIAKQWVNSFEKFARKKFTNRLPSIGFAGMGKRPKGNEDVVIGMYQTVQKIVDEDNDFTNGFGLVLMDEADLVAAKTLYKIAMRMNSVYKRGTTATPHRKDGHDFKVFAVLGDIVARVSPKQLQEENRYVPIKAYVHAMRFIDPKILDAAFKKGWPELINFLSDTHMRTDYIVENVVQAYLETRLRSIVFVERVDFAKRVAEYITSEFEQRGINYKAKCLFGEMPKDKRDEVLKDKDAVVLVATKVADRGMDLPDLGVAHLVFPSANTNSIVQRIGRVRRVHEGKQEAHVHIYVDAGLENLYYGYVFPLLKQEGADIVWLRD